MKKKHLLGASILLASSALTYSYTKKQKTSKPSDERFKNIYEFSGNYKNITIGETASPMIVKKSLDNKVRVIVYENENTNYTISETESLIVSRNTSSNIIDKVKSILTPDEYKIELHIPENLITNVILFNKQGNISVENLSFENLYTRTINGITSLSYVNAKRLIAISSQNGIVNFDSSSSNTIKLQNVNGASIVYDITALEKVDISSETGVISGYDIHSEGTLILENVNGSIELHGLKFKDEALVDNTFGNIHVSFTGKEKDYTVQNFTTTPLNISDDLDGEKHITLKSKCGQVKLTFED